MEIKIRIYKGKQTLNIKNQTKPVLLERLSPFNKKTESLYHQTVITSLSSSLSSSIHCRY